MHPSHNIKPLEAKQGSFYNSKQAHYHQCSTVQWQQHQLCFQIHYYTRRCNLKKPRNIIIPNVIHRPEEAQSELIFVNGIVHSSQEWNLGTPTSLPSLTTPRSPLTVNSRSDFPLLRACHVWTSLKIDSPRKARDQRQYRSRFLTMMQNQDIRHLAGTMLIMRTLLLTAVTVLFIAAYPCVAQLDSTPP